jgi:hypothetical protein
MLSRDEFAPYLSRFNCALIDEREETSTPGWSYWRAGWGFYFYVPEQGPDKACPERRFFEILADLSQRDPRPRSTHP